ncbi:MAG: hypothetical protein IKD78_13240 [Bacteroidales bacterium]|nr:hypothetical protein [Bacteroidales bacterium]
MPFDNYLIAAKNFGEQATFYPSIINSNHVNTGMEFFIGTQRTECLRLLASADNHDDGIISTTMPNTTTQKWHDLYGRPIIGKPASKGIYITGGKKILIK